eukprot:Clim_evm48s199 gene=Clim_evmTU48s199
MAVPDSQENPTQFPKSPRVNGQTMRRFIGTPVRLVGEVTKKSAESITLIASDQLPITVHISPGQDIPADKFVEVVGIADEDGSVKPLENGSVVFAGFGDSFDLPTYNDGLLAQDKYQEVFFD